MQRNKKLRAWSVQQILKLKPCAIYDKARLTWLWRGRKRLTLLEITALKIPPQDRMWVVWRVLSKNDSQILMRTIVTRAVRKYALSFAETREWALKWLCGQDQTTVTAWRTARKAAEAAQAAKWATEAAACVAAGETEQAAAAAAVAAAMVESGEREYKRQIEDTRKFLRRIA